MVAQDSRHGGPSVKVATRPAADPEHLLWQLMCKGLDSRISITSLYLGILLRPAGGSMASCTINEA